MKIGDIYDQFDPMEPLGAADERYVDSLAVRDVENLFNQLRMPLRDERISLLFSGLVGDGKTTLLERLRGELQAGGDLVAYGTAERSMNLDDVHSEDVILVILSIVEKKLLESYRKSIDTGKLRRFGEDVYRILGQEIELKSADLKLGPFGKLTFAARDASSVLRDFRTRLRQARGPSFLEIANGYLERAQKIVQEHDHHRLVVILDGLDKIKKYHDSSAKVSQEEQLFLHESFALTGIKARIIYTVNSTLTLGRGTWLMSHYGKQPVIMPMIPVSRRYGGPHKEGIGKLREIIARRLRAAGSTPEDVFESPMAVERLCQASGGYLRDLISLVRSVCTEAQAVPFTTAEVQKAIDRFSALQYEAAKRFQDELRKVAETHQISEIDPEVQRELVTNRLICIYYDRNEYWYDVSFTVRERMPGMSRKG